MRRSAAAILCVLGAALAAPAADQPLAEKYLLDGKLAEGEKALQEHLKKEPRDDQSRFGLGAIQFLRAFEHLGASLHRYGLRTEGFLRVAPEVKEVFPQNPRPEKLSYEAARGIVQTWVDDMNRAEATLAEIKDPDVKLPLHVGLIRIDPFGQNKPVSAARALTRPGTGLPKEAQDQAEKIVIGFDRGDVCWLRGYCHFLAAWGELLLAVDGQELFECTAHLFFEKVDSPHAALQEGRPPLENLGGFDPALISDVIAFIHLLRLPVKEPARTKAALAHLEAMLAQQKEMWKFILAETDDDNEWIPNPKQKGVLGVKVTREMIDAWLETVDEAEQLLKGKKLLPYWRGKERSDRGVNLRRVFTEPRTFDPILWIQGTAATPYLEKGTLTKFNDGKFQDLLGNRFGGYNLIGFAFWFN
jgi:hypothetical protein